MSGWLITLDKQPDVRPVGIGETWRRLFSKIVLKVTVLEATMTCQYGQLCAGLKAGINGAIHRVQALWDKTSLRRKYFFTRRRKEPVQLD